MSKIYIKILMLFISIQCQIFAQNTPIFKGGDIVKLTGVISKDSEKEPDGKITHYTWLNLDFPITYRDDPQYAESEVIKITKLWINGKNIQKFKQSARIEAEGTLYLWRGEGGAPCMNIKSARYITFSEDLEDSPQKKKAFQLAFDIATQACWTYIVKSENTTFEKLSVRGMEAGLKIVNDYQLLGSSYLDPFWEKIVQTCAMKASEEVVPINGVMQRIPFDVLSKKCHEFVATLKAVEASKRKAKRK